MSIIPKKGLCQTLLGCPLPGIMLLPKLPTQGDRTILKQRPGNAFLSKHVVTSPSFNIVITFAIQDEFQSNIALGNLANTNIIESSVCP